MVVRSSSLIIVHPTPTYPQRLSPQLLLSEDSRLLRRAESGSLLFGCYGGRLLRMTVRENTIICSAMRTAAQELNGSAPGAAFTLFQPSLLPLASTKPLQPILHQTTICNTPRPSAPLRLANSSLSRIKDDPNKPSSHTISHQLSAARAILVSHHESLLHSFLSRPWWLSEQTTPSGSGT